jgi:type I restriction enzyme S subunit
MRKDWTETSLIEILERSIGGVWGSEPGTDQEEVLVVRSTEFTKSGYLNFDTGVERSIKTSQLSSRELREGDILLEKSGGGPEQPVGRVVFVESYIPSKTVCSNFIQLLTPSIDVAVPRFIFFLMWMWHSQNKTLEYQAQTTGIRNLRTSDYLEQEVLLPSLAEQKRIVDVVSSVDAFIDGLQQQLNCALRAKSALLEKELLKDFSGTKKVKLGEVLEISRGGSPRPIQDYLTTEENGINWIKIGDATSSTKYIYETKQKIKPEGLSKTRKVYQGDFLLSNSMSFGRPYIMRTEGCIHDGWLLLGGVSKHFDEDFLYNFLRSSFIQAQFASLAAGSGVRNLNIDVVSDVEIVLPLVSDQKKIAQFLNSFDEQELAIELAIEKASVLRGAILSDLLSGKHEIPASYDSIMGAA